jgi:hypothetical protein
MVDWTMRNGEANFEENPWIVTAKGQITGEAENWEEYPGIPRLVS